MIITLPLNINAILAITQSSEKPYFLTFRFSRHPLGAIEDTTQRALSSSWSFRLWGVRLVFAKLACPCVSLIHFLRIPATTSEVNNPRVRGSCARKVIGVHRSSVSLDPVLFIYLKEGCPSHYVLTVTWTKLTFEQACSVLAPKSGRLTAVALG